MSKDKKIGELPVEGTLSNVVAIPAVNIAGLDVQFSGATIIDYVNSQIEINNDLQEVLNNGSYAINLSDEVFIGTKQDGYDAELKIGIEDIELISYVAGIKYSQLRLDSDFTRLKRDGDNGDFQDIRIQTDSFTIEAENNNTGRNSKLIFDTSNTGDTDIILRSEYFPGSSDRKAEIFLQDGQNVEIFTEDANNPARLSKIQVNQDALNLQYSKDGGKSLRLEMIDDFIGITNDDQPPYGPGQTNNTSRFEMFAGIIRLETFNQNSTIPAEEGESRFIVSPGPDPSVWLKSKILNGPTPFSVTSSISLEQEGINISTNYGGDSYGTSNISLLGDRLTIETSHNGVSSIFALKNDALAYLIEDALSIGISETTVDIQYDGGARYRLDKDGWGFELGSGTLSQDSLGLEYNQPMTAYGGGERGITFKADGPITIIDDSLLSQGIVYDANYHSVYTDRSLVDKEYVDTYTPPVTYDFGGCFLVYPQIIPNDFDPIPNPTFEEIENAVDLLEADGGQLIADWITVQSTCFGNCDNLACAINACNQILNDLANEESFLANEYQNYTNDLQGIINCINSEGLSVSPIPFQTLISEATQIRQAQNSFYQSIKAELESLKQIYEVIVNAACDVP
jgi:hypothetical protein